jgi:hypothetical protein
MVSQNDGRMWNKSYKCKDTYTVQLKTFYFLCPRPAECRSHLNPSVPIYFVKISFLYIHVGTYTFNVQKPKKLFPDVSGDGRTSHCTKCLGKPCFKILCLACSMQSVEIYFSNLHIFQSVHANPYQLWLKGRKGKLSLCLTENHEISHYVIFLIFVFSHDHI